MSSISHIAKCPMVATTTANTAAVALDLIKNVVLMILDRVGGEKVSKLVAAGVLVSPLLDSLEHVTLDLDMIIASSGVVERTEDVVNDLVNRDAGVFPSIEDATRIVSYDSWYGRVGLAYGTVYWRMVAAIRPAHELRMLVK
jgi:hypothetical protein